MKSAFVKSTTVENPTAHRTWSRKTAALAAIAALTITASTLSATPAHAGGVDAAAVEQVLRQSGAVTDVAPAVTSRLSGTALSGTGQAGTGQAGTGQAGTGQAGTGQAGTQQAGADAAGGVRAPAVKSGASLSLATGLTVPTGANTLSITPVLGAGASKALSPSGLAVFGNTVDSSFAFSKASTGGNAGYAVITGASAPTSYRFAFAVDGQPAVLKATAGGGVEVQSASGVFVNWVAPAWARDATGAELPTSYSVSGNILTQTVTHAGAVYPVVADPRVRCDSLWCTLELTRNETRSLASNVLNVGGACAIFGGAAAVCAAVLAGSWLQAAIALSRGQCLGFRIWRANFVSYPHLAYIGCYA